MCIYIIILTINAFVDLCLIFIPIHLGDIICVKQFITDSTDDIDNINTNNECILYMIDTIYRNTYT